MNEIYTAVPKFGMRFSMTKLSIVKPITYMKAHAADLACTVRARW
jgi:hypothetical protein